MSAVCIIGNFALCYGFYHSYSTSRFIFMLVILRSDFFPKKIKSYFYPNFLFSSELFSWHSYGGRGYLFPTFSLTFLNLLQYWSRCRDFIFITKNLSSIKTNVDK